MTVNDYQRQAMRTLNPALGKKDVLINSVMGLCGEAGEAIDIVKKWLAQGHELDRAHLVRELGDVAWYLAEAATALDVPLEDVLQANLDKLQKRFPEGFDASASVHRNEQDQYKGRRMTFRHTEPFLGLPKIQENHIILAESAAC